MAEPAAVLLRKETKQESDGLEMKIDADRPVRRRKKSISIDGEGLIPVRESEEKKRTTKTTTWELVLRDKHYNIQLRHGGWSGVRKITVNGEVQVKKRKFLDSGSKHDFHIDELKFTVEIRVKGAHFEYYLFVNDKPLEDIP